MKQMITEDEAKFDLILSSLLDLNGEIYAVKNVLVQKNLTSEEELKSYKEKYLTSDSIAELYNKSSFKYEAYYRCHDNFCLVQRVMVHPLYRREGYAKQILGFVETLGFSSIRILKQ
jgi:GNAT superfamily N-acetyltransferase